MEIFRNTQCIVKDRLGKSYVIDYYRPAFLFANKRASLIEQLTPLTGMGFMRGDLNSQALKEDVSNHVLGCERLLVACYQEAAAAFLAASVKQLPTGERLYHIEGIICHPQFEGKGLARQLVIHDFKETKPQLVAFHTQSKRMLQLGKRLGQLNFVDAYRIGQHIGTRNQQGIVDVGRYGGMCLYEDRERFLPLAIEEIDYMNGDALICAGPVRSELLTI